ncbi:gliding motility protein [Streptomyces sp. NPDC017529]|uniref:gliding motility protein n=1 Tax=Streptomyces sp. NPDC017529 TaxID=3365000 RepID=UPI0037A111C8
MGVFSRFRRRKGESSTEEASAATLTAEPEGAETDAAAAREAAGAGPSVQRDEPAGAEPSAEEAGEAAAAEGVEIPKQQSAGEAADSEAGEGARK